MLIDPAEVKNIIARAGIAVRGILHVGAHACEERGGYNNILGVRDEDIVWVDANPLLVEQIRRRGIPNAYTAVLDETERDTDFYIANNGQSSSILEFGTHYISHPTVRYVGSIRVRTQTLRGFFQENHIDPAKFNVWNFDIQGVELAVFKGSEELLDHADLIYTEVNTGEVYKGCGKLHELDDLLRRAGLDRVCTHMTGNQWGDAIYVRTRPPPSRG